LKKITLFLLSINFAYATNDMVPIGARAVGLGNAAVAISDQWAVFNNIAGVAALENTHVSGFYENRFNFSGFNIVAFAANHPTKFGNAALGVYRFGDELYNETQASFGWAHRISFVSLGIQAEYVQTSIQDLGTRRNVVINFGGQADITKNITFGAHVYNLNQARFAEYKDERIPTIMKAGLSFRPIKQIMLNAEVEKDIEKKVRYKFGLEYAIIENLKFRTGINIQPQIAFFGLGYNSRILFIDYAFSWHEQLGFSHSVSLSYTFLKRTISKPAKSQS
jgi:hypothetical protein